MKLRNSTLVFFVCALVACSGLNQTVPAADSFGSTPNGQGVVDALSRVDPQLAQRLSPMAANPFTCNAPVSHIPGKFTELFALGTVKGTTFTTARSALALWIYAKFVKAPPTPPPPTPGTTPTPKTTPSPIFSGLPPNEKFYIYIGSFALKSHGQGCAFLLAAVNGKPIKGQPGKASGEAFAVPTFSKPAVPAKPIVEGALTMNIHGLSANGGNGTAVLANPAGKGPNFDTATVTLTSRIEITI